MYEKIAKRIVNESLSVNKKDAVVINTWQHTIDFADALALECRKIGADVMVTLSTDKTFYGVVQDLPNEHVKTPAKLTLGLLDAETIEINISGPEDPSFLKKIDPEKFLLLQERNSPVNEKFRDRKIRAASCALGSVTPQRAKTYGLDFNVWKNEMNAALDVDYRAMNEFGTKLADKLEKTQEVHIKAPSGTDLKFEIQGRPVHILDGVVDQDDISKASFLTDLPAGYIILPPIETSANGKVIFDLPQAVQGIWLRELSWSFEGGRVTSFNAKENLEFWKPIYEKGMGDKDRIGNFMLGINPEAKIGFIHDHLVQGIVSISLGNNKLSGGKNEGSFGGFGSLSNATVELDGNPILQDGKYVF